MDIGIFYEIQVASLLKHRERGGVVILMSEAMKNLDRVLPA